MMVGCLLLLATATLTLNEAVTRAKVAARNADEPALLLLEAERIDKGQIDFDDVTLRLEHRTVDHFIRPRLDGSDTPLGSFDNTAIALSVPFPQLDEVVRISAAGLRGDGGRAQLRAGERVLARNVRRLVVMIAATKLERASLTAAIALAWEFEGLLRARRIEGTATVVALDSATTDRLALLADALQIDDDLRKARADLSLLLDYHYDYDYDVDDDIEQRCEQAVPEQGALLQAARKNDFESARLSLLDEALGREHLAATLGWVPWPDAVQDTFIHREPGQIDDVRLQLDINLPVFKLFDAHGDAVGLRRRANASQRQLVDHRLQGTVHEASRAVIDGKIRARLLLPATPLDIVPEDAADAVELALHQKVAERRHLRAVAACARAVVDVLSLVD